MEKTNIRAYTLQELANVLVQHGEKAFRAKQIWQWLWQKGVTRFEDMTNLSKDFREFLNNHFILQTATLTHKQESSDGTTKLGFTLPDGNLIETVLIPSKDKSTVCGSSQVGCKLKCSFCATGGLGFTRNLLPEEIFDQAVAVKRLGEERGLPLSNIVLMGMGEPLDNTDEVLRVLEIITAEWGFGWSPTRITLSTAGVVPQLRRFLGATKVHLAVSLHNPFREERMEIMPVERAWPIAEVAAILRGYDFTHQRRVSFEYIVLEGLNDSPRHIRGLSRLLDGIKCRSNLIRFLRIPGSPYFSPDDEAMRRFRDALTARGIQTTIRASRGEDIQAACGLLSTEALGSR